MSLDGSSVSTVEAPGEQKNHNGCWEHVPGDSNGGLQRSLWSPKPWGTSPWEVPGPALAIYLLGFLILTLIKRSVWLSDFVTMGDLSSPKWC